MSAPVHVPDEGFRTHASFSATNGTPANLELRLIPNVRNSVPVHGNLFLARVEFVKDYGSISNVPVLHLLLGDSRVVSVVVEDGLLGRHSDACRHKVQVLVQRVPELGVLEAANTHLAPVVGFSPYGVVPVRVGRGRPFFTRLLHLHGWQQLVVVRVLHRQHAV